MLITNLKAIHHTFHVNKKLQFLLCLLLTLLFYRKKLVILVADIILHYVKNTLIIKCNKRRKSFFFNKVIDFIKYSNIMFLHENSRFVPLKK